MHKPTQQGRKTFLAALALMIASTLLAIAIGALYGEEYLAISGVGVAIFGAVVIRFPFVTPQTIATLGERRGYAVGRFLGGVMIVLGLTVMVLPFLASP